MSSSLGPVPVGRQSLYVGGTCQIPLSSLYIAGPPLDPAQIGAVLPGFSPSACHEPRLPNTFGFSEVALYDLYADFISRNGSAEAKKALAAGQQVIVGLRVEVNTRVNQGRGVYNDRIARIWQDLPAPPQPQLLPTARVTRAAASKLLQGPAKHGFDFTASTQPSAQYEDPGVKSVASKKNGKVLIAKVIDKIVGPDGKVVISKPKEKWQGSDVNHDGRLDLGRLAEGTYRFYWGAKYLGDFALRPVGTQTVERDVNHDGWFTKDDVWHTEEGDTVIETGTGFAVLFHRGSMDAAPITAVNSWSAGCQTLPLAEHARFFRKLKKDQRSFYYVLVTIRN